MEFEFSTAKPTDLFRPGMLFLGRDEKGREIGIETERHALTVAGSGSGKGAALIIPNLKRWPHAALVIDPKGENAERTWQDRESMGQRVYALDPFGVATLPDHIRASFNPLEEIDLASLTAREDIKAIADGMVLRPNAKNAEWYDGAVSVLAGFIAHAVTAYGPKTRRLAVIRDMLNAPDGPPGQDVEANQVLSPFQALLAEMAGNAACGGLAQSAASLLAGGARSAREFLAGARQAIDSFGSDALRQTMAESSFRLSDLKNGKCTVFLILPPHLLGEHARFLRLFVRQALNAMAQGGNRTGGKCLFILDEFFSLGRIDEIARAAGLMRSYGLQLWPFLQDLGQLVTLYENEGAQTFFANSDAHIFFGNTDAPTLDYISARIGVHSPDGLGAPPMSGGGSGLTGYMINNIQDRGTRVTMGGLHAAANSLGDMLNSFAASAYQQAAAKVGHARLPADAIRELVVKKNGDVVARSMIMFGKGGDIFNLKLAPYFTPPPPSPPAVIGYWAREMRTAKIFFVGFSPLFITLSLASDAQPPLEGLRFLAVLVTTYTVCWGISWKAVRSLWRELTGKKAAVVDKTPSTVPPP